MTCGPSEEVVIISKCESTGKKAATAAGKVLANPNSTKAEKTAAASALTQVSKSSKSGKK